jgi:SAM-dependent methyltransferase
MLERLPEPASTPWRRGPFRGRREGLLFGQMYEDSRIELRAFSPRSRVFCIASAGCTARALAAAGHCVTAVDINPLQLAYAKSRAEGAPMQTGMADRMMSLGRWIARAAGWSRSRVGAFLALSDTAQQLAFWDAELDTHRLRRLVDTLLAPRILRLCYGEPFLAAIPRDFGACLRRRLRTGWAHHANQSNPYAASLLLGAAPVDPGPARSAIHFVCADAAEFLESCSGSQFDAFSLSNIGDGADRNYLERLRSAMRHAAAPGAIVVTRSFSDPEPGVVHNFAAEDRSLLWGVVEVSPV